MPFRTAPAAPPAGQGPAVVAKLVAPGLPGGQAGTITFTVLEFGAQFVVGGAAGGPWDKFRIPPALDGIYSAQWSSSVTGAVSGDELFVTIIGAGSSQYTCITGDADVAFSTFVASGFGSTPLFPMDLAHGRDVNMGILSSGLVSAYSTTEFTLIRHGDIPAS